MADRVCAIAEDEVGSEEKLQNFSDNFEKKKHF